MKKIIGLVSILVLMVLTACGGTNSGDTAVAAPASNESSVSSTNSEDTAVAEPTVELVAASTAQLNEAYESALSVQMQLALGTIILEQGNLVGEDTAQAAELLPLWRAVQSMSASGTAADAEIKAVVNQIQDRMTPEQIAAIADMQLTQDSVRGLVQDGVIVVEAGDRGVGNGGAPAGGVPGGGARGDGAPGGGQADPAQQATREAARNSGGNSLLNQATITAVVQMLETRAGS